MREGGLENRILKPEGEKSKAEQEDLRKDVVERFGQDKLEGLIKEVKENEGVPSELSGLVECFGKENLKNLIGYNARTGIRALREARGQTNERGDQLFLALSSDAASRVLTGKGLFSDSYEKEFLKRKPKDFFNEPTKESSVYAKIPENVSYLISTGENLFTDDQQEIAKKYIEKQFQSPPKTGLEHVHLGELAAFYRILTGGEPIDTLLKHERLKGNILGNLEDGIDDNLKSGQYHLALDKMTALRILSAEKFDIIRGKGIVFPEDKKGNHE